MVLIIIIIGKTKCLQDCYSITKIAASSQSMIRIIMEGTGLPGPGHTTAWGRIFERIEKAYIIYMRQMFRFEISISPVCV